jgi:hypothetical protein
MADNLTNQVRNIAQVTTSVAQGDLTSRIDVSARGEILQLKTTMRKPSLPSGTTAFPAAALTMSGSVLGR